MIKIDSPLIRERLDYLINNYSKHIELAITLWIYVKHDKSHPLRKALVSKVGFKRLEKQLVQKMEIWREQEKKR
jgi:hypothetical protein